MLGDNEISNVMPQVFGDAPEVAAGLLYRDAATVWRNWNPFFWLGIRFRGCLAEAPHDGAYRTLQSAAARRGVVARLFGVGIAGHRAPARGEGTGAAAGPLDRYLSASAPA